MFIDEDRMIGGALPDGFAVSGNLIPAARYTSREFLELEYEKLWPHVWQLACRKEEIGNVGDFLEYTIGDQSILVVHASPGEIKAFHNTCSHRGSKIREGVGNARELRCRLHAWRYNLDGSIKHIPDAADFDPDVIAPDCVHLPEVQVGVWDGFVFVNLDPAAPPLEEFLAPLVPHLGRYHADEMRMLSITTVRLAGNWKTALDQFNEVYHLPSIHPQTMKWMDHASWTYEQLGPHGRMGGPYEAMAVPDARLGYEPTPEEGMRQLALDYAAAGLLTPEDVDTIGQAAAASPEGSRVDLLTSTLRQKAESRGLDTSRFADGDFIVLNDWNIFPNLMHVPGVEAAFIWRFRPDGMDPDSCLMDIWFLGRFAEGIEPPPIHRGMLDTWLDFPATKENIAIRQDMVSVGKVQQGMHSRGFEHIRCGRTEANILNFHRELTEYLAR